MSTPHRTPIRRALLSVSDKSGLLELSQVLARHGVELLSTGGTARVLREAGFEVIDVEAYTGFPEMLDGRVKTLHPRIHAGLLARRELDSHQAALTQHEIGTIDLVVVNLYPFEKVAARQDVAWDELVENIDIGGPSMLRSAAKNHDHVAVLCDPADYGRVCDAVEQGGTTLDERLALALKVFARTAEYDSMIANELAARAEGASLPAAGDAAGDEGGAPAPRGLGPRLSLHGSRQQLLRYGENPHQRAAVYTVPGDALDLAGARPLQGKELSYNNLLDADAAIFSLRCLTEGVRGPMQGADGAAVVIIKHGTPCGAARAQRGVEAWRAALAGDPVSAFGGIVACSRAVDAALAEAMASLFLEVVLAPGYSDEARRIFAKKAGLRLLEIPNLVEAPLPTLSTRSIPGGLLVQEHDRPYPTIRNARVVTARAPDDDEWAALDVAFRLSAAVRSNAITLARGESLIGAGGGQTSRVDSVRIAIDKARAHGHATEGAVLGSDAFFPFADGLEEAARAGIRAVAQPGGSKRDEEVIAAADAHGIAMVFTGERHFRH